MTEEDEAFNDIERQAKQRKEAVKAAMRRAEDDDDIQVYQRPWVDLAPEDRLCAKYMLDAPEGIEAVIDYITAKLKEKNT